MSEEKKNNPKGLPIADYIEQLIHKYGDEIAKFIYNLLPQGLKEKLAKSGALRTVASLGLNVAAATVGGKIPNTPYWRLLDTAIKMLAAEVSDHIDKAGGEAKTLSESMKEKAAFSGAVIQLGLLNISRESADHLACWIHHLRAKRGTKAAHQALQMTDQMTQKELENFARLPQKAMTSYLEAWSFKAPMGIGELGFFDKQRAELDRLNKKIRAETERLGQGEAERRKKLTRAWQRLCGREEIYLLDKKIPAEQNRVATPIKD